MTGPPVNKAMPEAGHLYQLYGIFALVNMALEIPALTMGINAYYGEPAASTPGFSPVVADPDAIVMAALLRVLLPFLCGNRSLLIIGTDGRRAPSAYPCG